MYSDVRPEDDDQPTLTRVTNCPPERRRQRLLSKYIPSGNKPSQQKPAKRTATQDRPLHVISFATVLPSDGVVSLANRLAYPSPHLPSGVFGVQGFLTCLTTGVYYLLIIMQDDDLALAIMTEPCVHLAPLLGVADPLFAGANLALGVRSRLGPELRAVIFQFHPPGGVQSQGF